MGSLATGETAYLVLSRGDERTWGRLWPWPPAGPVLCSPRVPWSGCGTRTSIAVVMVTPRFVRSPAGATLAVTLAVTSLLKKTTPW